MTFYAVEQFPPLVLLWNNWRNIAAECNILDRTSAIDVRHVRNREDVLFLLDNKPGYIQGWDGIEKWLNYGIAINYQFPLGDAGIPKTVSLLKRIAGLKFASLSLFKGGAMLPIHTHDENEGLLTFHLGIDVPKYCCAVNVDGEMHYEANGNALVFDGTKPHYSFNASDKDRLILYCEFIPGGGLMH
jgi:hypothetical protein